MDIPKLFKDKFYQECIKYAMQSKGKSERYGSLWVIDNEIVGGGQNRALSNPNWNYKLERIVLQGYANHAEVEALNNGLMEVDMELRGGDIYVAGFFAKTNQLFFQEQYTCVLCPPKLKDYGVKNIIIPSIDGWKKRPIDEAWRKQRASSWAEQQTID